MKICKKCNKNIRKGNICKKCKKNKKKTTQKYFKKLEKQERNKKDKLWSIEVKTRDNNICVICSSGKLIHTHHIIPRENKKFRHDIDNGVSLCPLHHKYSYEISAHKNSLMFIIWLQENRKEQLNMLMIKLRIF